MRKDKQTASRCETLRAMASVNLSSVSLCEEDIPVASFHVFSLRLDPQSLRSLAFVCSVPVFYKCPPLRESVFVPGFKGAKCCSAIHCFINKPVSQSCAVRTSGLFGGPHVL